MNRPRYLSLLLIVLLSISFTNTPPIVMGISTENITSASALVKGHFIKGSCLNVANIESFGNSKSIGFFSNGANTIGFESGIIISTGTIKDAEGPNQEHGTTTSFGNMDGDPDLDLFTTGDVYDATGIEFDFIPFSDEVTFDYVFASEEYCEFVGSIFNDNFGFFVSGPGINGNFFDNAENMARLPNSTDYVTINSVNHIMNTASYIRNDLTLDALQCNIPTNQNPTDLIEFDGYTIPLSATFNVVPCETYHIRLVVGDVADDRLDSAVFLESKSFDLGEQVIVKARTEIDNDPIAFENCINGEFVFSRANNINISQPLVVNYNIDPTSNATPDVDYVAIPNSITIPANQISYTLPVEIIPDMIAETTEFIRLEVESDCACLELVDAELYIEDLNPLQLSFDEILVCPGQEFDLVPTVEGGASPYQFEWSNNTSASILATTIQSPTSFSLTITDQCANIVTSTTTVNVQQPPVASLDGSMEVCVGDTAFLEVSFEGVPPWSFNYSYNGILQIPLSDIFNTPFTFPVTQLGEYELVSFEDANCDGIPVGSADVVPSGVEWDFSIEPPSCPELEDGSISINIIEGNPPYILNWDILEGNDYQPTGLAAGTYNISITDALNCLVTASIELPISDNFESSCIEDLVNVPNAFSPNSDGYNDFFTIHIVDNNSILRINKFQIFNRWGAVVFEAIDLKPSLSIDTWNGFFNGKKMNPGVFVWMMELELNGNQQKILSGDLSLMD